MSVCISYEPKKFESKAYILAIVIIQSIVLSSESSLGFTAPWSYIDLVKTHPVGIN